MVTGDKGRRSWFPPASGTKLRGKVSGRYEGATKERTKGRTREDKGKGDPISTHFFTIRRRSPSRGPLFEYQTINATKRRQEDKKDAKGKRRKETETVR